jgi:hypothetical protein
MVIKTFNMQENLEVWTASYLDRIERYETLKECIQSVAKFQLRHKISVSCDEYLQEKIKNEVLPFHPNIMVFFHTDRKQQFEHIDYLYRVAFDSSYQVLFLDDDDILVDLPYYVNCKGLQYGVETLSFKPETPYTRYEPFQNQPITIDFSGTVVEGS